MEPISGNEFLKQMRQDKTIGAVPVIVITAIAGQDASWLAGADAYLRKPFNQADLRTAIKGVLG
jgi:CheY-like chemotaxis protein